MQHLVAATDMAGAAYSRSRRPLSEARAPTEVVMAAKRPDFRRRWSVPGSNR